MHKFLLLATAAFALSGCNKGADADGDGKVSNAEATAEMAADGAMVTKPGMWEVKMTFADVDAPGAPAEMLSQIKAQAAKGITMQSCMTKEQAEKPGTDFFGGTPEANCSFDKLDRSGNSINVEMTCKPAGNMVVKSKMDGTFAAETYSMNVVQSTEGMPGGAVKMTGKVDAKRVGDCPA